MHTIETPFGEPGFLVLSGSRLYGIDTPMSDYDYAGALVEPEEYRIGLSKYSQGKHNQHGFEQHAFKGDNYEGTIYSLWKLVDMLSMGHPTSLCYMFATPERDDFGICTPEFRKIASSKKSGHRFLKYMEAQRKSMIGQRSKHVTRQKLVDAHGFDTKFAAHVIRLGYQGIEFLNTGHITLPATQTDRLTIREIREGKWTMDEVLLWAENLEEEIRHALERTQLPDDVDHEALNQWLVQRYWDVWAERTNERISAMTQSCIELLERNRLTS